MVKAGYKERLKVVRQTPIGYMLSGGFEEEILLHQNEVTKELEEGEEVEVFLYMDQRGRSTATMHIPFIEEGTYEWLEVVDVDPKIGVFVYMGINKDLFIGETDLPPLKSLWPKKGDKLYCTMKVTTSGKMYGKIATEEIMKTLKVDAPKTLFNREIEGRIYRVLRVGSSFITEEGYLGFIHESQRKEEPNLGALVTARVIDVKEDGTINLSLIPRKQDSMDEDANEIYAYMEERGGAMPFWDKSYPEDIRSRFNMSKASFKRALGKLMKDGKVYQEEGWTYFKRD
ncbi:S1 RNA-binding domain-containing protein [Metabacillus iocasae]|nr:S1-like domain-containing RNA-binding protein [Metabacillus iocasae]